MGNILKSAIIAAGGLGKRIGSELPKQFMMLGNKPVIAWSVEAFYCADSSTKIIIAIPDGYEEEWNLLQRKYLPNIKPTIVTGGKERFHTVKNALQSLQDFDGLVAVHDAARPFISEAYINRLFKQAYELGSAVPALPISDSIRRCQDGRWQPMDRSEIKKIQTPQVFRAAEMVEAYSQNYSSQFTDDATVMEASGISICMVEGDEIAFKITTPADLKYAEFIVSTPGFFK
jgi:2-C-methyl-D-erythritol 4-phosphate cytidylyltransferase